MRQKVRTALTGPAAHLGEVLATDVAQLILSFERTIQHSARAVLGRPGAAGRPGLTIENAAKWRLRAVHEGSVVLELELPDSDTEPDSLDFNVSSLAEEALRKTLQVIADEDSSPEIAAALADMAEVLGIGERYEQVWIEASDFTPGRVSIDAVVRRRLRAVAGRRNADTRAANVSGTLYEADFERRSAQLRSPDGKSIRVTFTDDLADDIHTALRRPVELEGEVKYDPRTAMATSVELRRVVRADQLMLGLDAMEFWRTPSIADLRRSHGVEAVEDVESLRLADVSDEELEAFLGALAE